MTERPLQLVAPWWGWPKQLRRRLAQGPRTTRPHLQKFDRPDFVPGFLGDPQRSLVFNEDDEVSTFRMVSGLDLTLQGLQRKADRLFAPKDKDGNPLPNAVVTTRTGVTKLFLDTHKRYYAVSIEVHCDAAGFPCATAEEICQAGFVVRRRHLSYAREAEKPARALLKEIAGLQLALKELSDPTLPAQRVVPRRPTRAQKLHQEGALEAARAELQDALAKKRAELGLWKEDAGASWVTEGWIPTAFEGVGEWAVVDDDPQILTEATFPLFPLLPPPDDADHDAQGRAIYFGVIPTSALDTDRTGRARFDDHSTYEVRCFVRRHRPGCPRTEAVPDCHGEVFWSAPSEPYRLASQSDLVGTSQRPVTIQMPDLAELAALASSRPLGRFSPTRVVQKQSLIPKVSGMAVSGGSLGAAATCFFAIPLVTLVAIFLFNIFLPIVVFIFGLWFLLALRFCIPPAFSLDVGLQAELDALASLDVDLDAAVSVTFTDPRTGTVVTKAVSEVRRELVDAAAAAVDGRPPPPLDPTFPPAGHPLFQLETSQLFGLTRTLDQQSDLRAEGDGADQTAPGLDLLANLEFEPRESLRMVIA